MTMMSSHMYNNESFLYEQLFVFIDLVLKTAGYYTYNTTGYSINSNLSIPEVCSLTYRQRSWHKR